jgi:DNA-binding winged helix-turn-helix (wHTH) protein
MRFSLWQNRSRLAALSSGTSHETLNSLTTGVRVVFGACEFDSISHTLLRHGQVVPLSPRAFRFLELLLDRRPGVVSKAELLDHLWPGTFVSDGSLHNLAAEVRAAIADAADSPRFIRTVPRIGYGFHGDARPVVDERRLPDRMQPGPQLVSKRRQWRLAEGTNIVGRDPDCEVSVDSPGVSRRHARIVVSEGTATIEDLESKNGTYLNGARVKAAATIDEGAEVRVGSVTMVYRTVGAVPSTVTQRPR